MKTLLSIFSFKSVSARIILAALVAVIVIEVWFHFFGILLDDRASVGLVFKRRLLESGTCRARVAVIGSSQAMALDARSLELKSNDVSVCNYAVPNLETSWQYFLTLKLLLDSNVSVQPELVLLSVPYPGLLNADYTDFAFNTSRTRYSRFIRMFKKDFVEKSLPVPSFTQRRELDEAYAQGIRGFFPSYRMFPNLVRMFKRGWFGGVHIKVNRRGKSDLANLTVRIKRFRVFERVRTNRELIDGIQKSNGQLLFGPEKTVEKGRLLESFSAGADFESALEKNLAAVDALIKLAQRKGIKVVFFNMPVPDVLSEHLRSSGMMAAVVSGLERLEADNNNFSFLEQKDFYDWETHNFSDTSCHLNHRGAARFNDEFADKIFVSVLARLEN